MESLKHIDEQTLEFFVLESDQVTERRSVIELHLKECKGCATLYQEIEEYYAEVKQIQEERIRTSEHSLARRDRIIPFHTFIDRSPISQVERIERKLPVRVALFLVRHPLASTVSLVAAFVLGALLLVPKEIAKDINPAYARPSGEFLVAYNKGGVELWKVHVGPRYDSLVFLEANKKLIDILDVDGDGKNEVICAFRQIFGEPLTNRKKQLACYNPDGTVRWIRRFQKKIAFGDDVFDDEYHFTSILAGDFDRNETPDLITHVESALHHPSALVRLNPLDGSVISEYWHPGYLKYLVQVDLDGDGIEEILAAGLNYLLKSAVLAVFDPRLIEGTGPTPAGKALAGVKPGSEKFYILFPPTLLRDVSEYIESHIGEMHLKQKGGIDAVLLENMGPSEMFIVIFQFDSSMKCVNVTTFDETKKVVKRFQPEAKFLRRLQSTEYFRELQTGVRYWNGDNFVAEPTMNKRYLEAIKRRPLP